MNSAHKLMLGVAASVVMSTGAFAAGHSGLFSNGSGGFEGFYAGVLVGGFFDGTSAYLTAPDVNALSVGVAVGVNFYLTDSILGGFEVQGTANFGTTATVFDALALGRIGFAPSDDFLVYGASGLGVAGGVNVYAVGGGVEFAALDSVGVRGEILALGPWGGTPNAMKATVGLIWHMQ